MGLLSDKVGVPPGGMGRLERKWAGATRTTQRAQHRCGLKCGLRNHHYKIIFLKSII